MPLAQAPIAVSVTRANTTGGISIERVMGHLGRASGVAPAGATCPGWLTPLPAIHRLSGDCSRQWRLRPVAEAATRPRLARSLAYAAAPGSSRPRVWTAAPLPLCSVVRTPMTVTPAPRLPSPRGVDPRRDGVTGLPARPPGGRT